MTKHKVANTKVAIVTGAGRGIGVLFLIKWTFFSTKFYQEVPIVAVFY